MGGETGAMSADAMFETLYSDGARALQDRFDARRLADRLAELTVHDRLNDGDIELIRDQRAVWIATVDADGWPDVSYKGGAPGFIEVVGDDELRIPSYDGNGMFRTLGHVIDTGQVGLLFVDTARPWRLRIQGTATVSTDAADLASFHEANAVLIVRVGRAFPNCGRYIHQGDAVSPYVPVPGVATPVPEWKRIPVLAEALPAADPARAPGPDPRDPPPSSPSDGRLSDLDETIGST